MPGGRWEVQKKWVPGPGVPNKALKDALHSESIARRQGSSYRPETRQAPVGTVANYVPPNRVPKKALAGAKSGADLGTEMAQLYRGLGSLRRAPDQPFFT